MPEPYSISLLNDSFPPLIDGVANTVVNYAQELTKLGDRAIVVTPEHPDADDSRFPFPVARYPSVDTRRLFGYLAGYPFSPETLRQLKEQKVDLLHSHCPVMSTSLARSIRDVVDAPLVFTYHTKFDVDVAKLLRGRLLQESALYVLASNISACDEVWVVSHGAGENLRSIGYQGDYQVMENGVDLQTPAAHPPHPGWTGPGSWTSQDNGCGAGPLFAPSAAAGSPGKRDSPPDRCV